MKRLSIFEDDDYPAGTVIISVQPPIEDEQCNVIISRKANEKAHLGESGWQTSKHIFKPRHLEQTGELTLMVFGSELTTPISLNTSLTINLPDAGIEERHFRPEVTEAYGTSQVHIDVKKKNDNSVNLKAPILKTINPEDEPLHIGEDDPLDIPDTDEDVPSDDPHPLEEPKRSKWPLFAILILIMLAVIGGGLWYSYSQPFEPAIVQDQEPEEPPVDTVGPSYADRYQQYLTQGDHSEELFKLGKEAFEADEVDLGFKALTLSSDRGFGAAHLLIGRWYDPLIVQQSPLRANPNIAADYYAKAIAAEANSEAVQLLAKFCNPRPADREALLSFNKSAHCQ